MLSFLILNRSSSKSLRTIRLNAALSDKTVGKSCQKEHKQLYQLLFSYIWNMSSKIWRGFFFVFLPRRPPTVSVMISFVCIVLFKSVSPWDFPPNGFAILQITSSCIALLFRRCPLKCEIRWCPAGVYCNCRFWPFFTGKKPFFLSEMLYIMH